MHSDFHTGHPDTSHKPASFAPLGWLKARFQDVMTVADVLHDAQWSAPWDEPQSSSRPTQRHG